MLRIYLMCPLLLVGCPSTPAKPPQVKEQGKIAGPGKALDSPCVHSKECVAGLDCGPRQKGEWEDKPPAGKVCRGASCEQFHSSKDCKVAGQVCCPLITGLFGPYCLPDCRPHPPSYCVALLGKSATCNREAGCCFIPKARGRKGRSPATPHVTTR